MARLGHIIHSQVILLAEYIEYISLLPTGTPPFCSDECPLQYPNKLAIGKGGCNNGERASYPWILYVLIWISRDIYKLMSIGGLCEQGHKALCCPPSFRPPNCKSHNHLKCWIRNLIFKFDFG